MDAKYGQGSTFDASDKQLYLNIEKEIQKYPSPRIELVKRIGGFDQKVLSHKIEWSLKDNRPVKSVLAVDRSSSSAITLIVTDPGVFNVDDLIQGPDGEQMIVTAVTGGTQLTIKAWAGTPHKQTLGDVISRIGGATAQGKIADSMVTSGFEDLFNYTSILEDVVDLSGTENEALIRGHENSGQLIARKQQELAEVWQSQMVLGIRTMDAASKTYTNGGIKNLIDTYASENVIDFGGSAVWSGTGDSGPMGVVDDALDLLSAKVFGKPVMYVGAKFMRKFKYALEDTNILNSKDVNSGTKGVGVVATYLSHLYGKIDVVQIQERTGWMDDLVFLVDESDIGQKAMQGREWQTYPLARVGDSFRWQILSERTVKIGNPHAHVYLHNLGV